MTIDVDISEEESGEENDLGWKVTKSSKTKDRATGGAKEEEKLRMTELRADSRVRLGPKSCLWPDILLTSSTRNTDLIY